MADEYLIYVRNCHIQGHLCFLRSFPSTILGIIVVSPPPPSFSRVEVNNLLLSYISSLEVNLKID